MRDTRIVSPMPSANSVPIPIAVAAAGCYALDAVRWEVATKLDPVQISFIAAPKMRVGEPYIRKEDIPLFEKAHAEGGMDGLIKAIPDSYVEGMTASGMPDEVQKRVQQYRDAGVQIPLLRPAAAHQTQRLLDLFAQ